MSRWIEIRRDQRRELFAADDVTEVSEVFSEALRKLWPIAKREEKALFRMMRRAQAHGCSKELVREISDEMSRFQGELGFRFLMDMLDPKKPFKFAFNNVPWNLLREPPFARPLRRGGIYSEAFEAFSKTLLFRAACQVAGIEKGE